MSALRHLVLMLCCYFVHIHIIYLYYRQIVVGVAWTLYAQMLYKYSITS